MATLFTTWRANSAALSLRPSPGPSTSAPARSAISATVSTPAGVWAPSSSGRPRLICSSRRMSMAGCAGAGTATCTYPAPAREAERAAIVGAPVRPAEPPATTTTPEANFEPVRSRCG